MKGYPIGIDLGTAYTRVAFFNGNQMNIIKDDYGNDAMPSYVAFTDSGVLVGEAARKQALENPTNTIFDVIHLIGRRSSDPLVQNNISLWPFKVSASPDDKLLVEVNWKSKLWHFTPVEICSLILIQMKKNAEKHLGATIADAVITVPVHYNYEQQQAIRQAGMIASLNFMQIICAPAASALFYGIERKHDKSSRKLVNKALKYFNKEPEEYHMIIIDVGAGTTDVSLVTITEDICKVRATAGNIHLGELNFNNTMVYYFINWIKGRRCLDISKNAEAVSKLRAECDRAKVLLSSATGTVPMMISIGPQYNNVVIELSINAEKFNQLNNELFSMCQATIDACLRDADMDANMVHDVILAGGSTRIPMLQSYIRAYFGGKMLNINKNLETATACGAAYQAFFCSVTVNKNYLHLHLLDFTSFYLGIQFPQEKVTVHVPKTTIIPSLSSYYNKTTMPLAKVYEDEPNIPCDFNVGFEIQENGILTITAEEISSGMKKYIIINDNSIEDSRMRVWEALHYKESEVKDKPEEYAIGIDFGTTNSCVAVWQQDCVKIIEDKYGNRLTCSTVAFTDTGRLIGDAIHKEQVRTIPENTIPNIKRLISKCCNQSSVMNGRSMVSVRYKNENKVFAPEEIAAMILSKMKEIAEAHLGSKVTKAVVSVPACFNDSQRQAIMDAGVIAGLNVLELLNEPSAAAIAYFLQKVSARSSSEKTVLIFDLGGGNLDVSILTINEGTIRVQAVVGDTELGGEDFDNNMVSHFVKKFMEEKERDISNKPGSLTRLRAACEKAKRVLSTNAQAVVEIDALDEGVEFSSVITRVDFEEFNRSLFNRSIDCVERCLKDAKMDRSSIDEVVLVGGSTRIPKMQQLLYEFFHEKELCKSMNADEAVVYGAAVRAAILSGNEDCEKFNISQLQDVTSLPFWLGSTDGAIMHVLIPKNTPIPAKKELLYTTCSDNLSSFTMEVLQYGLASSTVFNISGIVPKPRLNSNIILTFEVDHSGILNLTAKDASTGENYEKIVISKENVCLTEEEIEKMKEASDDYRKHDEENKARAAALNSLEKFAYKMKAIARDQSVSDSDKKLLVKAAEKAILWLETSDDAGIDGINKWKNKLETITSKVIT